MVSLFSIKKSWCRILVVCSCIDQSGFEISVGQFEKQIKSLPLFGYHTNDSESEIIAFLCYLKEVVRERFGVRWRNRTSLYKNCPLSLTETDIHLYFSFNNHINLLVSIKYSDIYVVIQYCEMIHKKYTSNYITYGGKESLIRTGHFNFMTHEYLLGYHMILSVHFIGTSHLQIHVSISPTSPPRSICISCISDAFSKGFLK